MKRWLVIFVFILGFGQVNWQREVIDSVINANYFGKFNSLALDTNGIPGVVYFGDYAQIILYAVHLTDGWQVSIIDTITYRFPAWSDMKTSIACDTVGRLGIAYIGHDDIDPQYLKYAHYNGNAWDTSRLFMIKINLLTHDHFPV